jgi:hypothetical protein
MRRVILAVVICLAGSAFAENISGGPSATPKAAGDFLFDTRSHIRLGKDDVTWTAAGILGATSGGDNNDSRYTVYGSMGYFVTDQFELEGCATLLKEPPFGEGASLGGGINMYVREPVAFDGMYPYVGVGLTHWLGDFDEKGTHFQAKIGIRQYFTDNLGLRVWVEYDRGDNLDNSNGFITAYIGVFSMVH